jgi:hypothetical protein
MYQAAAGGGYSGEIASTISSGGTGKATFGAINFGAGATVGGASGGEGAANNTPIYLALAALVLVFLLKR